MEKIYEYGVASLVGKNKELEARVKKLEEEIKRLRGD